MKKVRIKTLALHYFKGVRSLEVALDGDSHTITGRNGSGKSTLHDAFTWLLWGKNAGGDAQFLIKTVDATGEEIPNVSHEVAATLDIDGVDMTLRRTLVPEYDKQGNLKGNHTDYMIDDVPLKKSEFDAKVAEIVSEEVFKFITSPYAFLTLHWSKQREMLVNLAGGDVADVDVAKGNAEFEAMLARMTGKTIEERKRELANKIKMVNEQMEGIPVRIDELKRTLPDAVEEAAMANGIAARRAECDRRRADTIARHTSQKAAADAVFKQRADLLARLNEARLKAQRLTDAAEAEQRNAIHTANAETDRRTADNGRLCKQRESLKSSAAISAQATADSVAALKRQRESLETDIDRLRKAWVAANDNQFAADDALKCPIFGHLCTDATACHRYANETDAAYEAFTADKQRKLQDLQQQATALKQSVAAIDQQLERLDTQSAEAKAALEKELARIDAEIADNENYIAEHPHRPLLAKVEPESIDGWKEAKAEADRLQAEAEEFDRKNDDGASAEADEAFRKALAEVEEEQRAIERDEAALSASYKTTQRIGELERELRALGAQKSELEVELATVREFEVTKCLEVSARVNRLFEDVQWRLFERQVNGEEVPACTALVGGVKWTDANTAARINAGIEVADVLSRHYGVEVPIFVDNAECSGHIRPTASQQIQLKFVPTADGLNVE